MNFTKLETKASSCQYTLQSNTCKLILWGCYTCISDKEPSENVNYQSFQLNITTLHKNI